jgi:hypothetical protein
MAKVVALVVLAIAAVAVWRRDKVKDDVHRVSEAGKHAATAGKEAAVNASAKLRHRGNGDGSNDAGEAVGDAVDAVTDAVSDATDEAAASLKS